MASQSEVHTHRHGARVHSHPHSGRHRHLTAFRLSEPVAGSGDHREHSHSHAHAHRHPSEHSHGLIDETIKRSREGIRAVFLSDGNHAKADAYVSLAVVALAAVVALGLPVIDPVIGLLITLVILRITWASWQTVVGSRAH